MRIIQRLASAYRCLDERRCLIDSASRVWIWVLLEPIGCGRCVSLASRRLGAKVVQCRIGVGGGCSLTRTPPSYTPVQNQACIPRVRMAVRYPGSPLPRPLSDPFRRGDESPLRVGPDVYAGTLPASPLHPHQRGGHPLFFGYWVGVAWSGWTFCVWKICQLGWLMAGSVYWVYHPARINPAPCLLSRPP